jgi:uncharacterized repeat protein (TIGR02543 family)/LPXTG-motif cell wall-anchored protein
VPRRILRLLALAAVILVAWALPALPAAQAADDVPVPVASPSQPGELPPGSKGCYPGNVQCAAVSYRGLTVHLLSRTDNFEGAYVAAYDSLGRLQSWQLLPVVNRYYDAVVAVDAAARTFTVRGQYGESDISFAVLEELAATPLVTSTLPARFGSLEVVPYVVEVTASAQPAAGAIFGTLRDAEGTVVRTSNGSSPLVDGRMESTFAGDIVAPGTYTLEDAFEPAEGSGLQPVTLSTTFEIFLQHRVTFVSGDTIVAEVLVEDGQDAQAPTPPARAGYSSTGWNRSFADVTSDITVAATYEANDYIVSFDAAGGTVVSAPLQVTFDAPYGPLPVPERAGYDFDGWVLALEDGSVSTVDAETIVSTPSDHVLEAAWRLDATVDSIVLTPSDTEVAQGGSVTFAAEGFNDAGLSVGDVTADVTLASDVATDVVDGATVTFPTASPHTITATHVDGATDAVVVEVRAAATPAPGAPAPSAPAPSAPAPGSPTAPSAGQLPTTGGEPLAAVVALAMLLIAGGALTLRRRATR